MKYILVIMFMGSMFGIASETVKGAKKDFQDAKSELALKLENVETKVEKLVDRKKRDKRLTTIKAEASRSKNIQQLSSLTDVERSQTKRELKKYLLEASILQEKIAELDEMLFLDSGSQYVRWSK